jgi:hypothetical protein
MVPRIAIAANAIVTASATTDGIAHAFAVNAPRPGSAAYAHLAVTAAGFVIVFLDAAAIAVAAAAQRTIPGTSHALVVDTSLVGSTSGAQAANRAAEPVTVAAEAGLAGETAGIRAAHCVAQAFTVDAPCPLAARAAAQALGPTSIVRGARKTDGCLPSACAATWALVRARPACASLDGFLA